MEHTLAWNKNLSPVLIQIVEFYFIKKSLNLPYPPWPVPIPNCSVRVVEDVVRSKSLTCCSVLLILLDK